MLPIKAPFDNAAPHCTLIYLLSFIIYVMVIFSPFLLTNKIVIIEDITLSREAVFKWHLKSLSAETGRPHAQRITLSEWGACEYAYFSMCVCDLMDLQSTNNTYIYLLYTDMFASLIICMCFFFYGPTHSVR